MTDHLTMDDMVRIDAPCRKGYVIFLVLSFLTIYHFFNTRVLDIHVWRMLDWVYSLGLFIYTVHLVLQRKFLMSWLVRWRYLFVFIGIVLISFLYLMNVGQAPHQSYRTAYIWFQLLLLVVLMRNEFTLSEVYWAVAIFSVIWMVAWVMGFLSPVVLFDASGEYDESMLSEQRGVVRLKIAGSTIMELWGMWSLGLYLKTKRRLHLLIFCLCLFFVVVLVSRQHIVYYAGIGLFTLLYKVSMWKKIIFAALLCYLVMVVLPQTVIYQRIVALTERQMEENKGGKEDVRIKAMEYYLTEYPTNPYTIALGHGKYQGGSPYGKHINRIAYTKGYYLSDIGWVGTYFYYGIAGLICMFVMLYDVFKTPVSTDFLGIKLYFGFLALGSIFSHSIEASQIGIALGLYILYLGNTPYKPQNLKTYNVP